MPGGIRAAAGNAVCATTGLAASCRHAICGGRCLPGTGIVDNRVSKRIDHVPLRILPRRHAASKRI